MHNKHGVNDWLIAGMGEGRNAERRGFVVAGYRNSWRVGNF